MGLTHTHDSLAYINWYVDDVTKEVQVSTECYNQVFDEMVQEPKWFFP